MKVNHCYNHMNLNQKDILKLMVLTRIWDIQL